MQYWTHFPVNSKEAKKPYVTRAWLTTVLQSSCDHRVDVMSGDGNQAARVAMYRSGNVQWVFIIPSPTFPDPCPSGATRYLPFPPALARLASSPAKRRGGGEKVLM